MGDMIQTGSVLFAPAALIEQLDHDDDDQREAATAKLLALREVAVAPMRQAARSAASAKVRMRAQRVLNAPVSPRLAAADRQPLRALGVLERIGTHKARAALTQLASGADGAPITEAAKQALGRMGKPPMAKPADQAKQAISPIKKLSLLTSPILTQR